MQQNTSHDMRACTRTPQETERMKAIVAELGKLGAEVEEGRDYCVIQPPSALTQGAALS